VHVVDRRPCPVCLPSSLLPACLSRAEVNGGHWLGRLHARVVLSIKIDLETRNFNENGIGDIR
jgi:hypothetical protein